MEEIAISKFKATCLAVIRQVQATGKPIRVTKFGEPMAVITPAVEAQPKKRELGTMAGTVEIRGDIVGPTYEEGDWDPGHLL